MKRAAAVMGLGTAILIGGYAVAVEPTSQRPTTKRQVLDCMTKRMSADRAVSYNDAMKACKDRILVGKLALSANSSVEAAGKSH
jgi:hypothetical protein